MESRINVYDISNYKAKIIRKIYAEDVILDLNKKVEELKKMVYEQTKVPIERQLFYLNNIELTDDYILKDRNFFSDKLSIEISKIQNFPIKIKSQNSEIQQIYTDVYNTGFEFLEDFQDMKIKYGFDIQYNLKYNNEILN